MTTDPKPIRRLIVKTDPYTGGCALVRYRHTLECGHVVVRRPSRYSINRHALCARCGRGEVARGTLPKYR